MPKTRSLVCGKGASRRLRAELQSDRWPVLQHPKRPSRLTLQRATCMQQLATRSGASSSSSSSANAGASSQEFCFLHDLRFVACYIDCICTCKLPSTRCLHAQVATDPGCIVLRRAVPVATCFAVWASFVITCKHRQPLLLNRDTVILETVSRAHLPKGASCTYRF